jgi:hypothetical protein
MKAPKRPADAVGTAGTAGKPADRPESKQRRGFAADRLLRENCGMTAGELRELREEHEESSLPPALPELQPLPMPRPARSLVRLRRPKAPREVQPAAAPTLRGDGAKLPRLAHSMVKRGRAWAVHDPAAVRELVRAAVLALRTLEYGRRNVNPEEIGTHLDLAKIERELRAALAKLGHPAATQPARSPVDGVGRPQG